MANTGDLLARIEEKYPRMSKGYKRIAGYIVQNYDKAAFMTANRLGERAGVSESTVVRFADSLGYGGYPQLQKAIQEMIRNKLTTVQMIEMSADLKEDEVLSKVMKADMENIRATLAEISPAVFDAAVNAVLNAEDVYVMGMRSAAPLSQFLGYYLDFMLSGVRIVNSGISDVFEQIIHLQENDCFIGISFPRYSNRTLEAMRFAKSRGAKCVAITDSAASPLAEYADIILPARSDMASLVDSLCAPFSLVNALIVAVAIRQKDSVSKSLSELEKIWGEHNIYAGAK